MRPRRGRHAARDAHQRGRFAGTVGADQRHDLARLDSERHAFEHLDRPVAGMQIFDFQQRRHQLTSSLPR